MIIYDRQTREKLVEIPDEVLTGVDMRKFDLRYADLSSINLSFCNFKGMDLEGAEFSYAILRSAVFSSCNLSETIFSNADCTEAKFNKSRMAVTAFSDAILDKADLSEIFVGNVVNFKRAQIRKAVLRHIKNLAGADFFQADLSYSDFEGTDFSQVGESDRTETNLTGTIFEYLM